MAVAPRRRICPDCGQPITRGVCPECSAGGGRAVRRGRPRRAGSSPVVLSLALGGGAAVLLVVLLFVLGGGGGDPAPAPAPPAAAPVAPPRPAPPPPDPWPARRDAALARFGALEELAPAVRAELQDLRREALRQGDDKGVKALLDLWVRLAPDDEEARQLRGDVRYRDPLRRPVEGVGRKRWEEPRDPRTGEETPMWISAREEEAFLKDGLRRAALEAVDTVRRLDPQVERFEPGKKKGIGTWFFFDDDVAPRPFFICSQGKTPALAKERAEAVVRILAALRGTMLAEYGELMKKPEGAGESLIPIMVFAGDDAYNDFRRRNGLTDMPDPVSAAGFFTWNEKLRPVGWLFVWSIRPESEFFADVIAHEGTHLLQFQYTATGKGFWGTRSDGTTTWFQEGLAEYWGGHELVERDGRTLLLPGRIQSGRLGHLVRYLAGIAKPDQLPAEEPHVMPFRKMLRMSYRAYFEQYAGPAGRNDPTAAAMVGMFYAQGWAFVHFLHHFQEGKYRHAFLRYLRTELKGEFQWRELERALGVEKAADWDRVMGEFLLYIREVLQKTPPGGFGVWRERELGRLAEAIGRHEGGKAPEGKD